MLLLQIKFGNYMALIWKILLGIAVFDLFVYVALWYEVLSYSVNLSEAWARVRDSLTEDE